MRTQVSIRDTQTVYAQKNLADQFGFKVFIYLLKVLRY